MMLLDLKCKAFSCESSPRFNQIAVDANNRVYVWDSIAGHYTTCHNLSAYAIAKIRKLVLMKVSR